MPLTTSRCLAVAAVIVAGLCTTVMNWRFAFQLASNHFDAYVWAVFSVALDVCKWMMLPFAALAWRIHKLRSVAALSIWLVATCYSFVAALGFAAINRETTAALRRSQTEIHDTLKTMRQSQRWQSSAACADATAKQSKEFCAAYRTLEKRLTASPVQDDPQSELVARLTGLSHEQARLVLALSLAVACELVSALGLFAIWPAFLRPQDRSREADHAERQPSETSLPNRTAPADLAPPRWRPRKT